MILSRLFEQSGRHGIINVLHFAPGLPQIGDERVAQDREKPGAQLAIGFVLVPVRPGLEERSLNQILGPMFVGGPLQRTAVQGLLLRWQQDVEWMSFGHRMILAPLVRAFMSSHTGK